MKNLLFDIYKVTCVWFHQENANNTDMKPNFLERLVNCTFVVLFLFANALFKRRNSAELSFKTSEKLLLDKRRLKTAQLSADITPILLQKVA